MDARWNKVICAGRSNYDFLLEKQSRVLQSRVFSFPDGLCRHISLNRWYWQALEQVKEECFITEEDVINASYKSALEWCEINNRGLEANLRYSFGFFIQQFIYFHYEAQSGIANQNDFKNHWAD